MDTKKVIADLRKQLQMINQIIRIVEHLAASHERRRGRPPKRLKQTRAQNTASEKEKGDLGGNLNYDMCAPSGLETLTVPGRRLMN